MLKDKLPVLILVALMLLLAATGCTFKIENEFEMKGIPITEDVSTIPPAIYE